jgi:hypothetical protein
VRGCITDKSGLAAEHRARLDAIRADLDRRAAEPPITMDELDQLLADWRAKRESSAA